MISAQVNENIFQTLFPAYQMFGVHLKSFLIRIKNPKKGSRVLEMALSSGPKNAGEKPRRRKRTNKEKAEVTLSHRLTRAEKFPAT